MADYDAHTVEVFSVGKVRASFMSDLFSVGSSLEGAAGPASIYRMRALDGGLGVYVYWSSVGTANTSPAPTDTTPNYTGSLSSLAVVGIE